MVVVSQVHLRLELQCAKDSSTPFHLTHQSTTLVSPSEVIGMKVTEAIQTIGGVSFRFNTQLIYSFHPLTTLTLILDTNAMVPFSQEPKRVPSVGV